VAAIKTGVSLTADTGWSSRQAIEFTYRVQLRFTHLERTSAGRTGSGDPWPDSLGGWGTGWLPGLPPQLQVTPICRRWLPPGVPIPVLLTLGLALALAQTHALALFAPLLSQLVAPLPISLETPVSATIRRLRHRHRHLDSCAPGAAAPGRGRRSRSPGSGNGGRRGWCHLESALCGGPAGNPRGG